MELLVELVFDDDDVLLSVLLVVVAAAVEAGLVVVVVIVVVQLGSALLVACPLDSRSGMLVNLFMVNNIQ